MNVPDQLEMTEIVPAELAGERLDRIAAELFEEFSRSRLQKWIGDGSLLVDGARLRPRDKVAAGRRLTLSAELEKAGDWEPQPIDLDVVHQDEHLVVLNKPAGLVVHPGAGNPDDTLLNGLLYHYPELASVPRAGIVHRLDKDTSGLMVVARSLQAQNLLAERIQERRVSRRYLAVVIGVPVAGETIHTAFGRHPGNRLKMAVLPRGREAVTHFRVARKFDRHALLDVQLETGRTHQIRVHLAYRKLPIVGDTLYGARPVLPQAASPELQACLQSFPRQALHATALEFRHPMDDSLCRWEVPVPADMQRLLDLLSTHVAD